MRSLLIPLAVVFGCSHAPPKSALGASVSRARGSEDSLLANETPGTLAKVAAPTPANPPEPPSTPRTFDEELARARAGGFGAAADVIERRVSQERRKMKLEPDEGLRAVGYVTGELPAMVGARDLLEVMPKTTVELVRSLRERGVDRAEAERMAEYLVTLRRSLDFENAAPLLYRPRGSLP